MKRSLVFLAAAAAFAPLTCAVETRFWVQDSQSDYEKASVKRLSIRSDGLISLAPAFQELYDSATPYLWAAAQDSKGNLYAGGGSPNASSARLFAIGPEGKGRVLAELPGMGIHAVAVDGNDRIFAATAPDGKVYRIGSDGKPEVFYDPGTKYIWAMVFGPGGDLFVATGDRGEIHRVVPGGQGSVFFRTEEAHVRALAVDGGGNLIAGTEPGGLVLRVSPRGVGFVLYQTPKREVTAVAVAPDGSIFAGAVGAKQPAALPPPPPVSPVPVPSPTAGGGAQSGQPVQPAAVPPPTLGPAPLSIAGGSEIYRIDGEGYPRKVWSDPQQIVYAIGFDAGGRPIAGTGNKGGIYRLDSDTVSTLLLNAAPTQVTAFARGRGGELYAVTGNVGKLYRIGPGLEKDGDLESDVFDAGSFSYWGRLTFRGETNGGGISIETRSGNLDRPQKNWSPWLKLGAGEDGGRIGSPPARFLQWKVVITASVNGASPSLRALEAAYLSRNVAPVIQEIEVTPANYRFPAQTLSLTASQTRTLPPLGKPNRRNQPAPLSSASASQTMNQAKGFIGARWLASDDNQDTLTYKVEIRGAREATWKLIEEKVSTAYLSWDSTAFPDGEYRVRVTASDSPDNPAGEALTASIESEVFLIDNTPPAITGLAGKRTGGKLTAGWRASDALNIIEKAEYSLNGGPWLPAAPVSKLSDSRELDYTLALDVSTDSEQVLAVRVTDWYGNQRAEKTVVR